MTTTLYLLRHGISLPQSGQNNAEWPLSTAGQQQAESLASFWKDNGVSSVISSPYLRAVQTVQPFADAAGITIQADQNLGDQRLCNEMMPPADFQELTQRMWQDFNYVSEPNMESNTACQQRSVKALTDICQRGNGKTILVCTHAAPIALFLNTLDAGFGYDDWTNMKMPHAYKFLFDGDNFHWETSFISPEV
ncbi:MAG: histidine phosphatase family protein [Alphaproteobacteria bacterium]|nr:histidine phosphatase family protein [Alphaproteobacteria bacterium]MDD9920266.1 histidine phosphatase family protein [Alphaproteobacteria bacterium]